MKRALAWLVFAGVLFGVYRLASGWSNPWASPVIVHAPPLVVPLSPVLDHLPGTPPGCGEKCRD